jgi:hypothetical protein
MITIQRSTDKFDVQMAYLVKRWTEFFDDQKIDSEVHDSVYVDDVLVEFEFVRVFGAKIQTGSYVMVTVEDPEFEPEDGDSPKDEVYLIRFNNLIKPAEYETNGDRSSTVNDYLKKHSGTSFTREQLNEWLSEDKIQIRDSN